MELTPEQQALANTIYISDAFSLTAPYCQVPFLVLFHPTSPKEGWRRPLYNSAARALQAIPELFSQASQVVGLSSEGEELARIVSRNMVHLSLLTFQLDPEKADGVEVKGDYRPGHQVVAVDTYLDNQFMVRECQRRLASCGLELTRVGLVLGQQTDVIEELRASGIDTAVALTITDMLRHYLSGNRFDQATTDRLTAYLAAKQKCLPQTPSHLDFRE